MQVCLKTLIQRGLSTNQHSLRIRILFNDFARENGFFNVLSRKAFFERVLHGVAFDQVMSSLYTLANVLYIQVIIPVENVIKHGLPDSSLITLALPNYFIS